MNEQYSPAIIDHIILVGENYQRLTGKEIFTWATLFLGRTSMARTMHHRQPQPRRRSIIHLWQQTSA